MINFAKLLILSLPLIIELPDVNECEVNNGGCAHTCTNVEGGFICSCEEGFILASDKMSCGELGRGLDGIG